MDPAAVIAVDHCAAVGNVTGDTAHTGCAVSGLADALYGAGVAAVFHGGINHITGNTGNIVYGIDPGIRQADILDGCSVDRTEQAHVFIHIIIEVQAADCVTLAVKLAGVLRGVSAADGHPFSEGRFVEVGRADVVEHILVDHNIGGQLAVDGAVATVDLLRKPVELAAVADLVIAVAIGIVAGQMAGIVELKIADVYLCDIAVCGKFCSGIAAGIFAKSVKISEILASIACGRNLD